MRRVLRHVAGIGILTGSLCGCHDLAGTAPLPAGVHDPVYYDTPDGALQRAQGVTTLLRVALKAELTTSGLLTDELTILNRDDPTDLRTEVDGTVTYAALQRVRGHAQLARAAVRQYAPDSLTVLGELYAVEGYTEVLLADVYCSGIPLSTVQLHGDYTYLPGSSTAEVYRHAAALLDTATSLTSGAPPAASAAVLARVGWGRALLALGLPDSAAHVVAPVPTTAAYRLRVQLGQQATFVANGVSTSNREGQTGVRYRLSNDPRTWMDSTSVTLENRELIVFFPRKYADAVTNDSTSVILASGVEARLIEAEADVLHGGSAWLTIVNALRTDRTVTVNARTNTPGASPGPAGYPDTTWGAGTGVGLLPFTVTSDVLPQCEQADPSTGITPPCTDTVWYRGLRPLTDPGVGLAGPAQVNARLDMIVQERAFWLYLTGHRQGDLRRLVRSPVAGGYGRREATVYPSGSSVRSATYGHAVVAPIPSEEFNNPRFTGCKNYDA